MVLRISILMESSPKLVMIFKLETLLKLNLM
nr:MAG TPA: hypothetical protein [Bacteriophage sp.]